MYPEFVSNGFCFSATFPLGKAWRHVYYFYVEVPCKIGDPAYLVGTYHSDMILNPGTIRLVGGEITATVEASLQPVLADVCFLPCQQRGGEAKLRPWPSKENIDCSPLHWLLSYASVCQPARPRLSLFSHGRPYLFQFECRAGMLLSPLFLLPSTRYALFFLCLW